MKFSDILTSSAHAFIIEGRPGETRDLCVQNFIKGLNCESTDVENRPCNCCASCKQIDAATSMDVFHMSRSGKTTYKVDDAVALIERLGMGSYGRHTIGVVDDADILSEIIQNKLLKTLEEPEEGSVIVLATSNRDKLLDTVRSRCCIVRVSELMGEDVDETSDERSAEQLAEIAEQLGKVRFHECRNIIDKKIKSREDAIELLGIMEDRCRENMIAGDSGMVRDIDIIEIARMDIYKGMEYRKALRRLCLELA